MIIRFRRSHIFVVCSGMMLSRKAVAINSRAYPSVDEKSRMAEMGEPKHMTRHRFFDINTRGSLNIFEAAAKRKNRISKIVYISSTAAYSVLTVGPVSVHWDELVSSICEKLGKDIGVIPPAFAH